jgi:hypothetical protein
VYEHRRTRPLPRRHFLRRVAAHAAAAAALLAFSLLVGILGYEHFEGLTLPAAFVNAAMLLGGMGPVDMPKTDGGRIFAGCYALYAGLVFILVAGLLLAPVLHRLLHKFHWETERSGDR